MALFTGVRADRLIKKLVTAVNQTNNEQYNEAVNKLAALGQPVLPIVFEAMDYVNSGTRKGLVHVISRLLSQQTLPEILDTLNHSNPKVVDSIIDALSTSSNITATSIIPYLKDPQYPNNKLFVILAAREEEIDALRLLSTSYELELHDKEQAFTLIEKTITQNELPDLLERVTGKDPIVRAKIIRLIAKYDDTRVISTLENLLLDKNSIVRQAALESITKLGGKADIKSLCVLLDDHDLRVQEKAVEAITKLNHPNTATELLTVLKSENEYSRRSAVEVLNEIGTVKNMKQLLKAILDEDWWVRSRAADAMSKIGGPKVVDAVLGLIHDENEDLRRIAVEILVTAKDPRAEQHLVKALSDEDWWVRERAADALAEMGSANAIGGLTKILGMNPKSDPIIIRAIGKLGNETHVAQLLPFANNDNELIKVESIKALIDLAGKDTVKQVVGVLKEQAHLTDNLETKDAIREGLQFLDRSYFHVLMEDGTPAPTAKSPTPSSVTEASTSHQNTENISPNSTSNIVDVNKTTSMLVSEEELVKAVETATPELDIGKLQAGDVLDGRYKYIRRIGKGAFGTVILMEDDAVGEQIILKFLNAHIAADAETMQRFVHELKFSRKITHQNVIRIFDFIKIQGIFAISMEYFPSKELSDVIRGNPIDPQRAVKIAMDVCEGMSAAHEVGIVHRDLKPANVLINEKDEVKVVDFGVAAAQSTGDTELTKTGFVIGSPKYMAPEQILGKKVDQRADVYAMGIIMYEMFTGTAPYTKGDHMAVMYQHVQGSAVKPHELNKDLNPAISAIITKAMTVNRDDRFQSMQEIKEAIAEFL